MGRCLLSTFFVPLESGLECVLLKNCVRNRVMKLMCVSVRLILAGRRSGPQEFDLASLLNCLDQGDESREADTIF